MDDTILIEALNKCLDKFAFYEKSHLLKQTTESDEKALVNRNMQIMISDALEKYKASKSQCDHRYIITKIVGYDTLKICVECGKEF